ncbi:hypothetical protein GCM10009574_065570 [Streptomyces asiaticus]|uniref:Uncharacterized protein n=1 Tax=Streptomyces rhizosphaericus TaxID=114699 RepID=A0ABN1S3I0_9ACTN
MLCPSLPGRGFASVPGPGLRPNPQAGALPQTPGRGFAQAPFGALLGPGIRGFASGFRVGLRLRAPVRGFAPSRSIDLRLCRAPGSRGGAPGIGKGRGGESTLLRLRRVVRRTRRRPRSGPVPRTAARGA